MGVNARERERGYEQVKREKEREREGGREGERGYEQVKRERGERRQCNEPTPFAFDAILSPSRRKCNPLDDASQKRCCG